MTGRIADNIELERAVKELRASEARLKETQRIAHVGWWQRDFTTNEACNEMIPPGGVALVGL